MKNYSSNRAGKGKTAYRTPSGFRANRPEKLKRTNPKLSQKSSYYRGRKT